MLVKDIMTSPVTTVQPDTTIEHAWTLLQERQVRHLPVVQDGKLVGTVSDRDVQAALARTEGRSPWDPTIDREVWRGGVFGRRRTTARPESDTYPPPTIDYIVQDAVVTVTPATPVAEAGRLLLHHKIGALPVVDGGALVGIVTESDLLQTLVTLLERSATSTG